MIIFVKSDSKSFARPTNLLIFDNAKEIILQFFELDVSSLKIIGFSCAMYAGIRDLTSPLGYIVFTGDDKGYALPPLFKSYKARRVSWLIMDAEMIAFCEMFDAVITLREKLQSLHRGRKICLKLFTDSKAFRDVI